MIGFSCASNICDRIQKPGSYILANWDFELDIYVIGDSQIDLFSDRFFETHKWKSPVILGSLTESSNIFINK